MVDKTNSADQTERAQLNEIAHQWAEKDEHQNGISKRIVQELSHTLYDQVEDHLDTLVNETPLTQREAEVWVLTNYADEHHHLLTEDAIALLFYTPNTEFGDTVDGETTMSEPVTSEEVGHYFATAEKKIADAEQTVGAVTFPNRADALANPELVWLNWATLRRLQDRQQPDDHTLNDIVTRLLDETETRRSLEELVRGYLNARGKDNVAQVAVEQQSFETGTLHITAHTDIQDDLPDIVTETDAITHHGHRYDLHFTEDPYGPHDMGRITLYASDSIVGMDEVQLEDGLAAADEYMQELLNRDEALPSPTVE